MNYKEVIKKLKLFSRSENVKGMARFGINPKNTYGIPIPVLRKLAKEIGKNHKLAKELWESGIHEARILASIIDEPQKVTEKQMEKWVKDFDSWDVCDQVCFNLFDNTEFSYKKIFEWSRRKQEFVKRTAFALIACLAFHNKKMTDKEFEQFFSIIKKESIDDRNFVKKAVNWAIRQIGKRNMSLNKKAIKLAKEIQKIDSKSAKWIAADAIKELNSDKIQKRINL